MLTDREWKLKYTPEGGDLVDVFYVPALEDAERYDRLTGYFNASALALAARRSRRTDPQRRTDAPHRGLHPRHSRNRSDRKG